jgi:hypothetical protein
VGKHKRGDGFLARSATKAAHFLQQTLAGRVGEAVRIRPDSSATLEVWTRTENRGSDADLAILRCTSDLDVFRADGTRVVTGDLGLHLRAEHLGLHARSLPDSYKKTEPLGRGYVRRFVADLQVILGLIF